jgi:hypothetical protein
MAKTTAKRPTRIKIGGVEVLLVSQPRRGTLSEARIDQAIAKVLAKKPRAKTRSKGGKGEKKRSLKE